MKKYWIIENGKPIGPFTSSELKVRRDFTATLPVWCAELPDWTTVGQLPELACLLPEQSEPQQQPRTNTAFGGYSGTSAWLGQNLTEQQVRASVATESVRRPNTYMGWSILLLICCCLPLGIAGLVFGSMVNRRWLNGDVEGARKASENVEWCLIIGIVAALVMWPFQFIFMMN